MSNNKLMASRKKMEEVKPEKFQLVLDKNHLEIIEEGIRKSYLSRLGELRVASTLDLQPLEDDLIDNVRLYHVKKIVYQKGESIADKFTTVYNTLATYKSTVFVIIDSNGRKTDFYIGVRNGENIEELKRSTVTLGETLKNTFEGHFPGVEIENVDRKQIMHLSDKVSNQQNIASVSVVGSMKSDKESGNEEFIQGIEKLLYAMQGKTYIGIVIAENQSPQTIQMLRSGYEELYTKLSPYQKIQFSDTFTDGKVITKSFAEMDGQNKAALVGSTISNIVGMGIGGAIAGAAGAMLGGNIAGQLNGFINSLASVEQKNVARGVTTSTTTENKTVTELLRLIDELIKKTNEYESYGMWNTAGYFVSDDMSAAEIAASNYRSLMNGEKSGREVSAINSWRRDRSDDKEFSNLSTYLSRFVHPRFYYGKNEKYCVMVDASTSISGKELGIHLGMPRTTVAGLPVIEHAEFGKEVNSYCLFQDKKISGPENRLNLGKIFDLGQVTDKTVELDNNSLNMHTFITGSTGSGKSNTVYQMLKELHQDRIPFLVIEPAKGEYKDVFGSWKDVNVFSTNPKVASLIKINPFKFPDSIHVLEHVDGLVEIFSVCWPMYDAMPAFFKDAILKSYEIVGWDLGTSTYDGKIAVYPDFAILSEQLSNLIELSDYASDIKSNYRGALLTRVKSLTVGLNKFIFTTEQTPYVQIFDENCIIDISRVKSNETKSLLMGLLVYLLNEYRMDTKIGNNSDLKHVTVLEEAHNLLKNTSGRDSDLVGKSVEMLTQTIAEIRTCGEGLIIVDQSPSSVDISAIKNTNTKIVLRTPEANDREAVGRSMGLTTNQVNEIAKLPSGVAVVYQNDWIAPVLTKIDKADIKEELYKYEQPEQILTMKQARTYMVNMVMQPWLKSSRMRESVLVDSLRTLDLSREKKGILASLITDYTIMGGQLFYEEKSIFMIQKLVRAILGISKSELIKSINLNKLENLVASKVLKMNKQKIEEICYILTLSKEEK